MFSRIRISFLLVSVLTLLLAGCERGSENRIIGEYILVETYVDPGDGNGYFQEVDSDKTLTFYADGTFRCNGNICVPTLRTDYATSGTYSSNNFTLRSAQCSEALNFTTFGDELVVEYTCIESCDHKFVRL